ncbi:hypothetical protein [Desulfitibacter alkalitolerans]|uniref:hypothetical protein n=1 Tax=Desulfitibacter alkalitolerans TaxID=264641 RepID=UPI0012ECA87B|nr:hypothetical protein [Desulfitibacter alkalitolerans]
MGGNRISTGKGKLLDTFRRCPGCKKDCKLGLNKGISKIKVEFNNSQYLSRNNMGLKG